MSIVRMWDDELKIFLGFVISYIISKYSELTNQLRANEEKMAEIEKKLGYEYKLNDKYRAFCKKEGLIVSRQFEKMMESILERGENDRVR